MAGITTVDTVIYRVVKLLRQYLDAEVDLIDTRNNAVAVTDSDSANNFTTPDVPSADVQVYNDQRKASQIRVIVEDGGTSRAREAEYVITPYGGGVPASNLPIIDRSHRIEVRVCVATSAGGDGFWGARRRCNRVADAVRVIMARFVDLSVPGATLTGFDSAMVELVSDSRASEVQEETWQYAERVIAYDVRMIEARA